MSYDADTTRIYVENGGGYCPECDHDEPKVGRPYQDDQRVYIEYACPRCKAQWMSWFILDDVQQITAGEYHNQPQLFDRTG